MSDANAGEAWNWLSSNKWIRKVTGISENPMKLRGTIEDIQKIIRGSGHPIKSVDKKDTFYRITTTHGAICNWHPSNGRVQFQGKEDLRDALETAVTRHLERLEKQKANRATSPAPGVRSRPGSTRKRVFIVHGHDRSALTQLELILHKLVVDHFVLVNTSGGGQTIIEALEKEIGRGGNKAEFGIVLLTPDDIGHAARSGEQTAKARARQNVILELGMLLTAVGRKNVVVLVKGSIELPSDMGGIIHLEFKEQVKEVVPRLAARLREAGFQISADAIIRAAM